MKADSLMTRLLILMTLLIPIAHATAADQRPNFIFFLSDDQRADFLGCAGHDIVKTPTIDSLAKRGVRFQNAFVTTSICAASRATLFTGQYERSHMYTFGRPPIFSELVKTSYPALLKANGYRTGFVGKFGVGVQAPGTAGMFDSFVSLNRNPYFKKQKDGSRIHLTDLTGRHASDFLKTCTADQPFSLSVSFNASHAEDSDKIDHFPWPETENGLYEDITIPPPLVDVDHWKTLPKFFSNSMHRTRFGWRWDTEEKYQKNVKAYYRMITGLDRVMGEVLQTLGEQGLDKNTVVIFMGDNGYYKGSRGFAGKWSHFNESLRVPLVIYDPRVSSDLGGRVITDIALNVDVPATMIDLAGIPLPSAYQGASLAPFIQQGPLKSWRDDFFCEHLMERFDIPKYEGVWSKRYVYARYFENMPEGEFLHDLTTDPLQKKNLAFDPKYAATLKMMRMRCNKLRDELGGEYTRAVESNFDRRGEEGAKQKEQWRKKIEKQREQVRKAG